MKKIFAISFCLLLCNSVYAQKARIDSLLAKIDRIEGIKKLYPFMQELLTIPQGDFALLKRGKQELADARLSGILQQQERALMMISTASFSLHDTPELLDASLQGIRISRTLADNQVLGYFLHSAGLANVYQREPHKGIDYTIMAARAHEAAGDINAQLSDYSNIESSYVDLKMPDSAMFFANLEIALLKKINKDHPDYWDASRMALGDLGEALASAGQADSALVYYRRAYLIIKNRAQKPADFPYLINNLAKTFLGLGKPDSAAKYGLESYNLASKTKIWDFTVDAASILAKTYEGQDDKKSVFYLKASIAANDSINAIDKAKQFRLIADRDRQHDDELKAERERLNNRLRLYLVVGAAVVLLIIGIILWRNNQKQKHTNQLLSEQKEEIEAQRDNLETTLERLKSTQTQLIQSEKMASLGELTAGIAHEIQNPLNFVNNFSEVNQEMIEELELELKAGNIDEALAIAADIKQNEEKINQHGKRADSIVKGMLQHSRTSGGEKQPTDLNAIADEFIKLSYHGMRAKDKSFNAELITNFDASLPKINVIPQDIGRVMLNLFNNAFYAVNQKAKTAGADYKPTVTVTTFSPPPGGGGWAATVRDNGIGIPDTIKDKIMQPFFTTKPTGEGTGLGLSLSYDIVVKAHGGKLEVTSEEGKYTEFKISIPI